MIPAKHWNVPVFLKQCQFAERAHLTSPEGQSPPVAQTRRQRSSPGQTPAHCSSLETPREDHPSLSQNPAPPKKKSKEEHKVPEASIL